MMYLAVRGQNVGSTQILTDYCLRRVLIGLRRFAGRVGQVTVRLKDVNGPRGGIDKRCQLLVDVADVGQLVFEAVHSDLFRAIDLAVDRAKHGVAREVKRLGRHRGMARRSRESPSIGHAD